MYPGMDIRPKFEVEKLDGQEYEKEVYTYEVHKIPNGEVIRTDDKGKEHVETSYRHVRRRVKKKVKRPMGYMVYTAKGDILHIATKTELVRQGFSEEAEMVDMESGEVVPIRMPSLKDLALRRMRAGAIHQRPTGEGAETLEELSEVQ